MAVLAHTLLISGTNIVRDGQVIYTTTDKLQAEQVYRHFELNYPKFFKMDILCKWSWLAAELLLMQGATYVCDGYDKNRVAVILCTQSGCLSVDHKYQQSRETIPSPALFVYTLPNIMLGEISIRHGFKGEQLCMMQDAFDKKELLLYVQDLFSNRGTKGCVCGWAEATDDAVSLELYWIR